MTNDTLSRLSREQLAQLCREYMLAAQFNSRTGYAALRINHGDQAYKEIAIDNWMAASPVYTRRMQRALGLCGGCDVETILKGMQLECGLSHQYFDARFRMRGDGEGEFWLQSCGALLETEPRGAEAVKLMCHDIEDPTFDATAVATNPRAQVRAVHRPPRVPADREPHCHWRVSIDAGAEPVVERDITRTMGATQLANITIQRNVNAEEGGLDLYDVPIFEHMHLERFSHSALGLICKELAIQIHLLVNSLGLVVSQHYGETAARDIAAFQMTGSAWVVSERLARWLGLEEGGIDSIMQVARLHPAFQPGEYYSMNISRTGASSARICIRDCPAAKESQSLGWFPLLQEGEAGGLESLIQGVDPRARLVPVKGETLTWDIQIGEHFAQESLPVQIAKGTVLYTTKLENHIQSLEVV